MKLPNIKLPKLGSKGQGSINSFFILIIGMVMLAAFLPIVNTLASTIIGGNMSDLANADIIRMIIGFCGVLLVLLFLMGVVSDFQQKSQYIQ